MPESCLLSCLSLFCLTPASHPPLMPAHACLRSVSCLPHACLASYSFISCLPHCMPVSHLMPVLCFSHLMPISRHVMPASCLPHLMPVSRHAPAEVKWLLPPHPNAAIPLPSPPVPHTRAAQQPRHASCTREEIKLCILSGKATLLKYSISNGILLEPFAISVVASFQVKVRAEVGRVSAACSSLPVSSSGLKGSGRVGEGFLANHFQPKLASLLNDKPCQRLHSVVTKIYAWRVVRSEMPEVSCSTMNLAYSCSPTLPPCPPPLPQLYIPACPVPPPCLPAHSLRPNSASSQGSLDGTAPSQPHLPMNSSAPMVCSLSEPTCSMTELVLYMGHVTD